jgi:fructose/tagatose bisphosphate aldolase
LFSGGYRYGAWIVPGKPKLNLELLTKIKEVVDIPLVLHGGSDLPNETVRESIRLGIRKFNVWTDLAVAQLAMIRKTLAEDPELYDPRKLLIPSMKAITAVVKEKINGLRCLSANASGLPLFSVIGIINISASREKGTFEFLTCPIYYNQFVTEVDL